MQIDNRGISLNVTEDGDPSAPPLVVLHGITSFGGTWDWFVPELAERYRVLRLDFRGHGSSARAAGEYHTAGYVSDAVTACERLVDGPAVFMGHSLGGITTAIVMQQRPDLVRAAILEDPPLGVREAAEPPAALDEGHAMLESFRIMRQTLPGIQSAGMAADAVAGLLAAAPSASGRTLGESIHPDGLVSMARAMLAVDPTVLDPVLEGSIDLLLDAERGFAPPTLIVAADPAQPVAVCDQAVAARLAEVSPATEVLTIAGAGHLIHDEIASRDTFRSAVLGFLGGIDP